VYRDSDNPRRYDKAAITQEALATDNAAVSSVVRWWQVGTQVGIVRQRFVTKYPDSSSNLDTSVKLTNTTDLFRYLPRAAAIGLFAPFPKMWFESGNSVGSTGRILSGSEMLLMYAGEALAIVGLLFSIAVMGTIALGLVVVNVGTLYRLRYVFLIMLIILAAGGISDVVNWLTKRQSSPQKVGA
jgi:hypothetical protein